MSEPITDTTLRSSGTLFHVFRGILILQSPFFRSLFPLPTYPDNNYYEGGLPIVDMQEDSTTLDLLLRFCYPMACRRDQHYIQALQDVAASICIPCRYGAIDDLQNFSTALDSSLRV